MFEKPQECYVGLQAGGQVARKLSMCCHLSPCSSEQWRLGLVAWDGHVLVLGLGAGSRRKKLSAGGSLYGVLQILSWPTVQWRILVLCLLHFPKKPLKNGKMRDRDRDREETKAWDLVKWLKVLAHLGSCTSHKAECISFMSQLWMSLHAQWAVLSASRGNGIKAEPARMPWELFQDLAAYLAAFSKGYLIFPLFYIEAIIVTDKNHWCLSGQASTAVSCQLWLQTRTRLPGIKGPKCLTCSFCRAPMYSSHDMEQLPAVNRRRAWDHASCSQKTHTAMHEGGNMENILIQISLCEKEEKPDLLWRTVVAQSF